MVHRIISPRLTITVAVALASFTLGAGAAETAAYRYQIDASMSMPHLDEMRRQIAHHTRCVRDDSPEALFPVLEQPALRGCRLGYKKLTATASGERHDYVLSCASARVASGTASIESAGQKTTGTLAVKMGGKNMTFSQRIEAERGAPCTPP